MAAPHTWEIHLPPDDDGERVVTVTGELALKESGALAVNVPGKGWSDVFSPVGWEWAHRVVGNATG